MKVTLLFALLMASPARPPQKPQVAPLTIPYTQAIPSNITESMNRQEDRLNGIEVKVAEINTSLADFKDDTQKSLGTINSKLDDMSTTNTILKFLTDGAEILIPGLIITWFGFYLAARHKRNQRNGGDEIRRGI